MPWLWQSCIDHLLRQRHPIFRRWFLKQVGGRWANTNYLKAHIQILRTAMVAAPEVTAMTF
jgi:hypothetical protein